MMVGEPRESGRGGRVMRSAAVSLMAVAGMGLVGPVAQAATPAQDLPLELTRAADGNGGASCIAGDDGSSGGVSPGMCQDGGGMVGSGANGEEVCDGGEFDGADIDRTLMSQLISDRNLKTDVTPVDWSR